MNAISATISSCLHLFSERVLFALICILLHIILGLISSMIKIIVPDHLIFDFKTGCMISSLTFASNLCSLPGAFLYHYHFPYQSLIIIININIIIIILLTFKFLKIEQTCKWTSKFSLFLGSVKCPGLTITQQKTASVAKALQHFAQVTSSSVNSPYLLAKTLKTCWVHKQTKANKIKADLGRGNPREIRQSSDEKVRQTPQSICWLKIKILKITTQKSHQKVKRILLTSVYSG